MFYIGMFIAAWLGGFVQTLVGFGAAVCMLLYLTHYMTISVAPSVCAMVCLALNISIVLQYRRSICFEKIWKPMAIYSAVNILVISLIRSFEVTALTIFFGIFLICIAIYYLFLTDRIKINDCGTGMMLISSSLSGLFSGLFSIGGPTYSVYCLALLGSGDLYIANIQFTFLISNVILGTGRAVNGLLTADMIPSIIVGIIAAITGQLVANRLREHLSREILSKLVYTAVGLSGILIIFQHI